MTSSCIPEVKKKLTFGVSALCCFVLIDCVEVCTTEKGYRSGVSFAARNESKLEGRAFLCGQKRQRTRDPPLGSCTYRAREPVPIPVQNGARVSCKWRIQHRLHSSTFLCPPIPLRESTYFYEYFVLRKAVLEKGSLCHRLRDFDTLKSMHMFSIPCSHFSFPISIPQTWFFFVFLSYSLIKLC